MVVQFGVASLLAFFFFALSRSLRLVEVRLWGKGWLANALALGAVYVAAFVVAPGVAGRVALASYALGKTFFVLLITAGMAQHLQPGRTTLLWSKRAWLFAFAWSLAVGWLAPNLAAAQMAQAFLVAAGFLAAAGWVWRRARFPRSRWLALALFLEGSLFAGYLYPLGQIIWAATPSVGLLPLTSFFDAGAELVLGMTMLMGLESSSTAQLRHLHRELVDSYERLRAVMVTDPLTGLANRLALEQEASPSRPFGGRCLPCPGRPSSGSQFPARGPRFPLGRRRVSGAGGGVGAFCCRGPLSGSCSRLGGELPSCHPFGGHASLAARPTAGRRPRAGGRSYVPAKSQLASQLRLTLPKG